MAAKKPSAEQPPAPVGRPSIFTPELIATICARIAGGESMRTIAKDESMPALATMFRWISESQEFKEQYTISMEQRAEAMFEEILEISDETALDTIYTDTGAKPNAEWISRSRLRVDSRKWMLAKMVPKKYGDRIIQDQNVKHDFSAMTDEELDARLAKASE